MAGVAGFRICHALGREEGADAKKQIDIYLIRLGGKNI
jgi:hypothetical protein